MARDPASETRARREAFLLAMARDVSVVDAAASLAEARWAASDARLAAKRCGTAIVDLSEDSDRPLQWWQRD